MKPKSTKQLIFLGVLAVFMVWGAFSLTPAQADSRPDFVVAVQKNPVTMEPMRENSNVHMRILWNVGEPLIRIDYKHNQKLIPGLATEWKRLDGSTLELKLRKGVKFHTGNEMDAEAVKFCVERTMKRGRGSAYIWGPVESVAVIDKYTVRFNLKSPAPLDLIAAAGYSAYIFDPKFSDHDWFNASHDSGTGPYMI